MDFQSAMETFAEAWVAANTKTPLSTTQNQALALTSRENNKTPPPKCESRDSTDRGTTTPAPPLSVTPLADTESLVSPPSIKDGFELSKSSSGKSLPVHCIVEAVCSLEESRTIQHTQWRRRPAIETDSYVIIPVGTPFHDLVQVALLRLGYSTESAAAAKGSMVVKNWKALSFDQITDDPLVTVGEILGELTTVATLRIQLFRIRPGALADIKDKLLRFLLVQSHGLLLSAGCPLDELVLSQICRGTNGSPNVPEPSEDCRRKFEQWWTSQLIPQVRPQSGGPFTAQYPGTPSSKPLERSTSIPDHGHPAMQTVHTQYPTQKTRMRTSFDPELELPKLQRWFTDNQHPSRQQIQHYVKELNNLESRRGRKPLDVNNVVYWFKNARAAQKRAEIRNIPPGLSCHLNVNGYNNRSPTSGASMLLTDGYLASERLSDHKNSLALNYRRNQQLGMLCDDMSNPGSDMEDDAILQQRTDDDPTSSPRPLSLTTTSRKQDRDLSPRLRTPPPPQAVNQQQIEDPKIEPKEEPENLHSPSDKSNNNKIASITEVEDIEDMEADDESKCQSEGSSAVSLLDRQQPQSRMYCGSSEIDGQLMPRVPTDGLERLAAGFPMVPNSMFSHSIMYMSHYIPSLAHGGHANIAATSPSGSAPYGVSALAASAAAADERRKRNRTFIDPVTEVPRLEQWFSLNTHPSHSLILKYTEDLNGMAYRQKFPRLEPKNVQFWFKNRRAKCKRLKMSLFENQTSNAHQYQQSDRE